MDDHYYKAVIKVFVDLYNKGLIYRGARMINWDPAAKTALSDEEVEYKEVTGKLYYIKYTETSQIRSRSEEASDSLAIHHSQLHCNRYAAPRNYHGRCGSMRQSQR